MPFKRIKPAGPVRTMAGRFFWSTALALVLAQPVPAKPPVGTEIGAPVTQGQATLLIQSSPLAGSQFHALPEVVARIRVGDALTLQREPDNPHDANAVRVLWQGHMLGYVPRRENKGIARALDRGEPLVARVVALRPDESPWRRLRFEIGTRLSD